MGFLSGNIAFERLRVQGDSIGAFGPEHLEVLQKFASGKFSTTSTENVHVGFVAGDHLFDHDFSLEKNVITDTLHCAVRVDSNQIPSALRQAWLKMELAALCADNPTGRPTKSQRQEAKEAVEHRCEEEAKTGKYHRMQQFPILWDAQAQLVYIGSSSETARKQCADLFERSFELELRRVSVGTLALDWAQRNKSFAVVDDLRPAAFHPEHNGGISWIDGSESPDFLGNEFLLWLWWTLETRTDTLELADGSEVTAMLTKTLALECPLGENGKANFSSESPIHLPEAQRAIRAGKLPRKSGLTLVRHGQQFDLTLQAESFGISGAKLQLDDDEARQSSDEDRIEIIRSLTETVDLLFDVFVSRRASDAWQQDLESLQQWLQADQQSAGRKAA